MEQWLALAAYTGANANELSLAPGDLVDVINREDADWWYGVARGQEVRRCGVD
jgi:hypothetical protein